MSNTITMEEFQKLLKKTKHLYISDDQWFIANHTEQHILLFLERRGYGIGINKCDNNIIEYYTEKERTIFKLNSAYDGVCHITLCIPILL